MNIKIASESDIKDIVNISKTSEYTCLSVESVDYYIKSSSHRVYILKCDKLITCAFIILFIIESEIDIVDFVVSKTERNKHFGSNLLEATVEETHAKKITLEVHENNTLALGFYKSRGFNIIAKRENYYEKPSKGNAIIMELNIL